MKRYFVNEKGQAQPAKVLPVGAEAFAPTDRTEITWLGNAGVLLNARGSTILIDPLLTGFDMPLLFEIPLQIQNIPALDAYLVTHIDSDHFSRETCTALKTVCKAFHSTNYVAEEMVKIGVPGTGHDIGGKFSVGNTEVTLTPVKHDCQTGIPAYSDHDWKEADCCGFWFDTPDGSIWLPGDSKLLESHLHMPAPDVILFDFSDNDWHITLEGAIRLANTYPEAKLICIHWGTVDAPTFAPFCGNPEALEGRIQNPDRLYVLYPGEKFTV